MRRITLWLLVASATFLLGAGLATFFVLRDSGPRRTEHAHAQPIGLDSVILDVSSHDGGMVSSTEPYLALRVYSCGYLEGDVSTGDAGYQLSRKSARLNSAQLAELTNLLAHPELSAAKEEYPQFAIYTDSGTFTNITFEYEGRGKKIALTNPNPKHPRNKANYPPALINLLLEIELLRGQLYESVK